MLFNGVLQSEDEQFVVHVKPHDVGRLGVFVAKVDGEAGGRLEGTRFGRSNVEFIQDEALVYDFV